MGEVLMVRPVQLKSDKKVNAGSAIGAAVGYGAARKVDGDYRNAARVAGGVIGGVAGTAIQNSLSGRRAIEIYVRDLSDKRQRVIAIVQDADVDLREGDRVFLVGKGSKTRVVPIPHPRRPKSQNDLGWLVGGVGARTAKQMMARGMARRQPVSPVAVRRTDGEHMRVNAREV